MDSEIENQLIHLSEWRNRQVFGKYRGTVETVETGDLLGYISVKVPDLFGADFIVEKVRPCSPFAGNKHGFVAIPEPGDGVWVEFEACKASLPIWTGFWWADDEMPEPKGPLVRSFITTKGHKLILNDDANEVKLLHADGPQITMTNGDITLKIGDTSIKMTSSDLTMQVGASKTSPHIKITSTEISLQSSSVGSVKLTSGGVDIGNGAMKVGA